MSLPPLRLTILVDHYPALSETFVLAEVSSLAALGHDVTVETAAWAEAAASDQPDVPVHCLDDDSQRRRVLGLIWLTATHPRGCLRDLRDRRRWSREEIVRPLRVIAPEVRRISRRRDEHLHVHFAAGAALDALRIGRLLGLPFSVTAHAYDIFRKPRNLREKLETAAVVTTGCQYNVGYLQSLVSTEHAQRIHEIVMGVDPGVFKRSSTLPGGRRLIGIGRLVEKKGFADLIEAVSRLGSDEMDELVLVGDGPLRGSLAAQVDRLDLRDRVRFTGPVEPAEVRRLLEQSDVLVMPCVIASDEDRDSMPVVVKEAMALELLIVGTDEVGLPEVVHPPWGRLVPPHDPDALAAAIAELLALPADRRAAAGEAARRHVIEHADVNRETARLCELIRSVR